MTSAALRRLLQPTPRGPALPQPRDVSTTPNVMMHASHTLRPRTRTRTQRTRTREKRRRISPLTHAAARATSQSIGCAQLFTPPPVPASTTAYRPGHPDDYRTEMAHALATPLTPLNLDSLGRPLTYRTALAGPDHDYWVTAENEEYDRLFATETMHPTVMAAIPHDRRGDVTYYNPQTKEKLDDTGDKVYRIRGTAGGDKVNYPFDVSARTADLDAVKILIHSVVSDSEAKLASADISDFYLNTPMDRPEFVRIPLKFIPQATIDKHKLASFIERGAVIFQVNRTMYGLPQSAILCQRALVEHLASHGYIQCTNTPCVFKHVNNSAVFTLVVDDFLVKYKQKEDAEHLFAALREKYKLKVNWAGDKYLGMNINFAPDGRSVKLSMDGYVAKVLARFCPGSTATASTPGIYVPPQYGAHTQTAVIDGTAPLDEPALTRLRGIVGCLLYYARVIDYTMLTALNGIASEQAMATEHVAKAAEHLLAYAHKHPDHAIEFKACDMRLHVQSDASYLSRTHARSVSGGLFYLGNHDAPTLINHAICAHSSIIPGVPASAAEAEYCALFMNGRHAIYLRNVLHDLGYPQGPTHILCDNACATGIATDTVKARRSKSIDMRWHWTRDMVREGTLAVSWRKGAYNLADFFTKILPFKAHNALLPFLVTRA